MFALSNDTTKLKPSKIKSPFFPFNLVVQQELPKLLTSGTMSEFEMHKNKSWSASYLCSSLRMWTLKVRGKTCCGSVSGGRASAAGSQRLNSASQFCSVFTWGETTADVSHFWPSAESARSVRLSGTHRNDG